MERTLVILKPGCLQRGLIGEVISRFEKRGLKLVAMKMVQLDEEILKVHYAYICVIIMLLSLNISNNVYLCQDNTKTRN